MIPQSQPKKPKNSSKANLIISAIFHAILLGLLFYFAARSGILGKKLKNTITAEIEHKKPEPPKPKTEPPKIEPPKIEPPKIEPPKTETVKPPPSSAQPVVAPPAAEIPAFVFDGGKQVIDATPVELYKNFIEYTLRNKWDRPDNMDDDQFAVEVAVSVDKTGNLSPSQWLKVSGNAKWDQSVKDVFKSVTNIGKPPPTNFPPLVTIRFDVDVQEEAQPVLTP